jgi:hypothetical protein
MNWSKEEKKLLRQLSSPRKTQDFLDNISYSTDEFYRSPRSVIRDRKAHCFDGALFAAAALSYIGFPSLIVDMLSYNDDEHIIALFKINAHYGAIAKSNFTGLRFREPIYKSLRELVMSYFEDYYNLKYEKTLRGYTVPLNLSRFDNIGWMFKDESIDVIADATETIRRYNIISKKQISNLSLMDEKAYQAGLLGSDSKGLYKV